MPPADMPSLFSRSLEPASRGNLSHFPSLPKGNVCDETMEAQPSSFELLWIDMGGEG